MKPASAMVAATGMIVVARPAALVLKVPIDIGAFPFCIAHSWYVCPAGAGGTLNAGTMKMLRV